MMSLARIQEPPDKGLVLLAGSPGAGKSTFCHQVILKRLAADRPVILVTSERSPADIVKLLNEKGMAQSASLNFVDAFTQTVGLTTTHRSDIEHANCADLNSISIAITKQQNNTGQKGILLVFDSLTSPYLFNGMEVVKFLRLSLSKFAAEGNSVLACIDEGCGKEEDLVAMMSMADGIIKVEVEDGSRVLNVVKHPVVESTRIKFSVTGSISIPLQTVDAFVTEYHKAIKNRYQTSVRSEVGDFMNVFWRSFTFWSGMLWDPRGFPQCFTT